MRPPALPAPAVPAAVVLLASLLSAAGCRKHEPALRLAPGSGSGSGSAAADPCAKAHAEGGAVPWFEDDLASAQACAAARHVPLVLDLWAPWCHTCLSMKTTVFTDPSFAAEAARFVFVSLDTDRDSSAAAVARYPLSAWPTFYVIDGAGAVLARFVGGATVAQFHAFLDAGRAAAAGGGDATSPAAHLLAAERATTAKDAAGAERELRAALAAAPADWPRRSDALVSLIQNLYKKNDHAACLELAEAVLAAGAPTRATAPPMPGITVDATGAAIADPLGHAASASDFLVFAMQCATARAKDEGPRIEVLRERAVARWSALTSDPDAPLSVDDRSDALANLRETLDDLGRKDQAHAVAEQQRALLDQAADQAATPTAASTYNWPRAEVYAYLQRPLDLVPALERSVAALPTDYDPRARLAWVLWKGGKLADAARRADEAAGMAYGPRKAKVLTLRADIAHAAGDRDAERAARTAAVATLTALPAGQASPEAIEAARKALAALDLPAGDAGVVAPVGGH
jgi:thioredoxin-like negative regulator of GroEL